MTLNCQGILHEFSNPLIMGIINTTPDSFFEGSRKNSITEIITQVSKFITEGVDIIDIGGYSSRPGAKEISEKEELQRVLPAIQAIRSKFPDILISIDTFRANVAENAIRDGANIINDISGGQAEPNIFKISAKYNAPYIMMHMKGTPQNMQKNTDYNHLIKDLISFFSNQIIQAKIQGVKDIIFDPGLGFSKTLDQNYEIIVKLDLFKSLELPILIGFTHPMHGESMSPYAEGETNGLKFKNETGMPIKIGKMANDCEIETNGEVVENKGIDIKIVKR